MRFGHPRSITDLKIPPAMLMLSGVQGVPVSKPHYNSGGYKEIYHRDLSKEAYSFTFMVRLAVLNKIHANQAVCQSRLFDGTRYHRQRCVRVAEGAASQIQLT